MDKYIKVLTHRGEQEFSKGKIGTWTEKDGFEWELFWDEDNEFKGVCIESLPKERIEEIEQDYENSKGFYSPDFEDTNIKEYALQYEL